MTTEDTVLQKTPFSFDVSVWEFVWPLVVGAKLAVAKPGGHMDTAYLDEAIRICQITTLHFVPSMLDLFLEWFECPNISGDLILPTLRRVFCSGEALLPATCQTHFNLFMDTELVDLYGPTEATVDVTALSCSL